jgi:hypothetical protein
MTKSKFVRWRTFVTGEALHLVRHGRSRPGLSTDCALLFRISPSHPSWALWKISTVSHSFHLSFLLPISPISYWTDWIFNPQIIAVTFYDFIGTNRRAFGRLLRQETPVVPIYSIAFSAGVSFRRARSMPLSSMRLMSNTRSSPGVCSVTKVVDATRSAERLPSMPQHPCPTIARREIYKFSWETIESGEVHR